LILIPLEDFLVAFLAFFWGVRLAVAFRLPARVFEASELALTNRSLADSPPGDLAKFGMARIRMSPSNPRIGEMKLSRAYI
jgi:hypothetical protein